jgi:hypothetical protein
MTFTLLTIITVLAAALSLYDGIVRLRGRTSNALFAVGEIIFGAIMLISIFVPSFPIGVQVSAIILVILLALTLIFRGRGRGRRGSPAITVIALILDAIVVLLALRWIVIPALN